MRQGLSTLLIALISGTIAPTVIANEGSDPVVVIEDALFTQQTKLNAAKKQVADKNIEISTHKQELDRLNRLATELSNKLASSKAEMNANYEKVAEQPDFDLAPSQVAYQKAWAEVKGNQEQRWSAELQLQKLQASLVELSVRKDQAAQELAKLQENHQRARVERLRSELSPEGSQTVSFTNVCQSNLTLGQCEKQTTTLALQKAVNQFQSQLIESTTEQALIKNNLTSTPLNIHVLRHDISNSGFYDGVRYRVVVDAKLESRPPENAACKLLAVNSSYCFAPGDDKQTEPQKEVAWVNLTIRSNQYNDHVIVDEVNYGSTPVEIMLPTGNHVITVEKEGYKSFHNSLTIKGDHTLRAILVEKSNLPTAGQTFADKLGSTHSAPEMTVIAAGQYLIGENASQQFTIRKPIAFASTPITVDQFSYFIEQSSYQTDAELKNVCVSVQQSVITPIADSYWRNPGFKQRGNSPAVCISKNDAQAYATWLSQLTGYQYRLPTQNEWEVAARANSEQAYWWGSQFDDGVANTGWSGSPWSNQSTSPVKSFEPNRFGLFDMVGNVWEWTSESRGVVKGGAWSFSPDKAAAHEKLYLSPSTSANFTGFRVVREL